MKGNYHYTTYRHSYIDPTELQHLWIIILIVNSSSFCIICTVRVCICDIDTLLYICIYIYTRTRFRETTFLYSLSLSFDSPRLQQYLKYCITKIFISCNSFVGWKFITWFLLLAHTALFANQPTLLLSPPPPPLTDRLEGTPPPLMWNERFDYPPPPLFPLW